MAEIAQAFAVHPSQIAGWKEHLIAHAQDLFEHGAVAKSERADEQLRDELYKQIGQVSKRFKRAVLLSHSMNDRLRKSP